MTHKKLFTRIPSNTTGQLSEVHIRRSDSAASQLVIAGTDRMQTARRDHGHRRRHCQSRLAHGNENRVVRDSKNQTQTREYVRVLASQSRS